MKNLLWIAATVLPGVTACKLTVGECWPNGEGGGDGAGGSVIVPAGAGGFGNVPREPQDAADAPPAGCNIEEAGGTHRCREPGSNACVDGCETIGAYCPNYARHPYSPSSGDGALYQCKNFSSKAWECDFKYANGDVCKRQFPTGTWLCGY